MHVSDVSAAVTPVVDVLIALGVEYRIGGSVASSALGLPRSTLDVDLVCALADDHVEAFTKRLADQYYVDADMIRDAIRHRSSFNVVHLSTMVKVDVFIKKGDAFSRASFARVTRKTLDAESNARVFDLTTAEDIILRKLEWYELGGRVSERQWKDVVGVLVVQRDALDNAYLDEWARALAVEQLLALARKEAASR